MAKSYPWFYAVNDRPVAIVETPSGDRDCLVFDFTSGNLTPDRAYFSEVVPGSGKDVDSLTQQEFADLVAACRVDVLYRWAERLCRGEDMHQIASLDPPPLGALSVHVESKSIELTLPSNTFAQADIEHRFGPGQPMTGPDLLTYELPIAGCTILATYGDGSWVKTIVLRIDRT